MDMTFVFSDFHGDLDTMAKSFAVKGLMTYDGNEEKLIQAIKAGVGSGGNHGVSLEKSIIRQKKPVRLFFLGDCLDRCNYGYHIIQFFTKVRWEQFNIHPVFLLGNHDLLNVLFFLNPFKLYRFYRGNGPSYSKVLEYIRSMGLDKSLRGFIDLHRDEIMDLQKQFYREGRIEVSQGHPSTSAILRYGRDYSFFHKLGPVDSKKEWESVSKLREILGIERDEDEIDDESEYRKWYPEGSYVDTMLKAYVPPDGENHWWTLIPGRLRDEEEDEGDMSYGEIADFNILRRKVDKDRVEILPIDWRVISVVWRKHYGDYFRRVKYVYLDGSTIFVHGGISVLSMMDPLVFGNLYFPVERKFRKPDRYMNLEIQAKRSNRLVSQVLRNALNDYSFEDMCGAEVIDLMGWWRGSHAGFPQFGGPLWSDFEYLDNCLKDEEMREGLLEFYRKFSETYGIKRIICGHTPFYTFGEEAGPLLKRNEDLEKELGLEYICVDNGCSRAYRYKRPVPNGIVIDSEGKI